MAAGGIPALGKSHKAPAARATHGSRRRTSPEVCKCSAEAKGERQPGGRLAKHGCSVPVGRLEADAPSSTASKGPG
eukprot:15439420-Alexandrium_andersonii.AAC.1